MSSEDAQMMESSAGLPSSYEQEMMLSSVSCEELSPPMEHPEQWNLPAEPLWKRGHIDVRVAGYGEATPGNGEQTPAEGGHPCTNSNLNPITPNPNPNPSSSPNRNQNYRPKLKSIASSNARPRADSSNDLYKQFDSSDNSDVMDDGDENGGKRKAPMSKNLMSERKRRKKLNEKLYSLRAVVPNISKMDKASIVSDAITYVRDLQKQVDDMQADITDLESQKDGVSVADSCAQEPRRVDATASYKKVKQAHRIVALEVSQMEDNIYHFRIHCKKSPGVLVHLTRALEALEFEILNANLTSVDDHILNTLVVEVKNGWIMKTEELRDKALKVIPKFGFCF